MVGGSGAAVVSIFSGRFEGRTAVVTGAASGIGRDVARRLSAEGARVSMWDLNAGALGAAAAEAGASDTQAVDIAAEDAVDAAMQRSIDALGGRLDILVASAGITGHNGPLKDYASNDWRKVFDVNVNGVFYSNRAAVRAMDRAGYGRIVNVASVAGKEGNPNASAYSASKAAVIALTKSLGKETATTGIRVNCITPAAIKTALFDQMTPQHIEFMLSKIPVGRFGTIEDATSLVCWLALKKRRLPSACPLAFGPRQQDGRQCRNLGDSSAPRRKAHPDHLGDQAGEGRGSYKRELQSLDRNGSPGWRPLSSAAVSYRGNLSGMAWIRFHPCARQVHHSSPTHPRDRLHNRRLNEFAKQITRAA